MIRNPPQHAVVQIWYRKGLRDHMPYHGHYARVTRRGRGKPRNHGVMLGNGQTIVVPAGNLRYPTTEPDTLIRELERPR